MLALLLPLGLRWRGGTDVSPAPCFISYRVQKYHFFTVFARKNTFFFARFVFLSYLCTRKQANDGGIAQLVRAHDS